MVINIYKYKLNKVVSNNCDAIKVEFGYKEDVGYVANVSLVTWEHGFLGFSLATNMFIYPPISITIVPCKEQNVKKSAEAFKRFKINALNYAQEFITTYNLSELNVKIISFTGIK
jgi:hypothetical protein